LCYHEPLSAVALLLTRTYIINGCMHQRGFVVISAG
jgi:hypothetical protein